IILGIPPLVIAVLLLDQKETLVNIIEENNLVVKYLNHVRAKLVRLYFDSAPHNWNWLGRTYFTNYEFQNKLGLIKESESILLKKFPLDLHLFENKLPLLSRTDFYHYIKKGCNMHNSGTHIVPIGNYVMSTEHLWQLYNIYGGKFRLTTDILNPKDKQSDELAEQFYSSRILR
ncbi:10007_t:CDS:2, partial [Scutellospora calospora]